MNAPFTFAELVPLLPELVLGVGALALLMLGVYRNERTVVFIDAASIALLIVVGILVVVLPSGKQVMFNGSFVIDAFARFLKILALAGSAAAILMSIDYAKRQRQQRFEYSVLILLSTLGMLMLISAADLIALYLGLELMSLPLYVVAASHRTVLRSTEAGLKYFVLGALSSGMLLYGASLTYGFTGTVSFSGIAHSAADAGPGLIFGLVFLFAGFCFKVSAVPFHMWTPDVYEGAPTPVTAFFAAAPKVAGIAMFVRTAVAAFPGITGQWQEIVSFVAIASMLLGSFAAIGQRNIKRLLAYSSIGHMGFALVGLAAGTSQGVQGVLVYMAIYVTMTLGVFAVVLSMRRGETMVESTDQLAGLARTNPGMAFFMAMLLFSMAGVPPLAGFFAKFYVFLAAIQAGLYALAVIGVLASVVGAYYYLAIIKTMYFDEPEKGFAPMPDELKVVLGASGLFNILFFVYPGPLIGLASAAAHSLF
jgi:NADH-quinone oxidoreductase subunit N